MGDNEASATAHELVHAFLDQRFGERINGTGGFVHNEDIGGVCQQGAGDADKLF